MEGLNNKIAVIEHRAYKQWGTLFPGAACVGALVDRFAQHCHLIDIDADSWRNKEAAERAARKKPRA